jgi:acyl carrier protein
MELDIQITKDKVRAYILQSAYVSEGEIQDNTLIFNEGYFDSMGFVMLISFLDEELGIKVMDAELIEENFESINAITNFIIQKKN